MASAGTANATKLYNERVNKVDSWQSIASRLEVEGLFNVNSTSVAAYAEYKFPADATDIVTPPTRAANLAFGRRFEIVSFRWLVANEV